MKLKSKSPKRDISSIFNSGSYRFLFGSQNYFLLISIPNFYSNLFLDFFKSNQKNLAKKVEPRNTRPSNNCVFRQKFCHFFFFASFFSFFLGLINEVKYEW